MWETVVVWIVVGAVAALAIRSFWKTMKGENEGCGGFGCSGCPAQKNGNCGGDEGASANTSDPKNCVQEEETKNGPG